MEGELSQQEYFVTGSNSTNQADFSLGEMEDTDVYEEQGVLN